MLNITFIIGCSDEECLVAAAQEVVSLKTGSEFDVTCLPVLYGNEDEIISAYEYGRGGAASDWYIFTTQNCRILDKELLFHLKEIFDDNKNIGIIGIDEEQLETYNKIEWNGCELPYYCVQAVNRAFVVSRVPIRWNVKIRADEGAEIDYCFEAGRAGYDTVVACKGRKWVQTEKLAIDYGSSGVQDLQKKYADYCLHESLRKNYRYYSVLKHMVEVSKGADTLKLIKAAAYFATMNFCGIYSDTFLERKLYQISNTIITGVKKRKIQPGTVLHVMSEAYATGGHTRVVLRWIQSDTQHKHSVVFTFPAMAPPPQWLIDAAAASGGHVFHLKGEEDPVRAKELYQLSSEYEKIVLHIHMWDVVPVLAYSHRSWTTPIYYMNHSSHTFWLGMGITDVFVILVTRMYNQRFMRTRRGVTDTPVEVLVLAHEKEPQVYEEGHKTQDLRTELGIEKDAIVVTSMATEWRYAQNYEYNFDRFVKSLISKNRNCYVLLIGPPGNGSRWQNLREETGGRCKALGFLPRDAVKKVFGITNIYVDSFIESSGGALDDAIAYGLPVFSMRAHQTWFEKYNYYTEEKLLSAILRYCECPEEFAGQQEEIQKRYALICSQEHADVTLNRVYSHKKPHRMHSFAQVMPDCTEEDVSTVRQFNRYVSLGWLGFLPESIRRAAEEELVTIYAYNQYSNSGIFKGDGGKNTHNPGAYTD